MREILFRGKRFYNGEWVEGYYAAEPYTKNTYNCGYILENEKDLFAKKACLVDSRTVGQYTGLNDKTGKKIFEGDIISCGYLCDFFVEYSEEDAEYWANFGDSIGSLHTYFDPKRATVIGNIYDNPELLEVKE